jgi:hypothetical protein
MLRSTQPDLINPVGCLSRLNTDRVIAGMLQYDANGIIRVTRPAIGTGRMNIQPIPHPDTFGMGSDLIVHLYPYGIRITAVYVGFSS